jgi:hypothetical protein
MYTAILNEPKAVLKVSAQTAQTGAVNKNLRAINDPGW